MLKECASVRLSTLSLLTLSCVAGRRRTELLLVGGGGQDGGEGVSDRHKYDDEAGDSDDGPGPEDSDFEDEEVDEDAAFDSADEAR